MAQSQAKPSTKQTRQQARGKRPQGIEKPQQPLRKSARLQKALPKTEAEYPLPSPPTTNPIDTKAVHCSPPPEPEAQQSPERERKRPQEVDASQDLPQKRQRAGTTSNWSPAGISDNHHSEQHKTLQQTLEQASTCDPVAHWARTSFWPQNFLQRGFRMSEYPSSKRRSESTHRSQVLKRLADHGIFMESSRLIQKDSKTLCQEYLEGNRRTVKTSVFTSEEFTKVLERVRDLNENRIVRDVMPWIVPSAEVLRFRNELKLDYIGDGLNVEWTRCTTMGNTKPKPDFIAALLSSAYTQEEIDKLENYARPDRPFWFTPELSYPFLMAEGKPGAVGLNEADRQNIHSSSIAVRAIFALYEEAFGRTAPHRVHELYGKVLVFSVSHDNDKFILYGHYAVAESNSLNGLKFYRHPINMYSLTMNDGMDQYKGYNFVWNIYNKFGPAHLKRIKDAAAHLPTPVQRTGLSFITAEVSVNEPDAAQDSQSEGQMMPPPSTLNTAEREQLEAEREKNRMLEEQVEQMNAQLNSFIKSNVQPTSGNNSEVVTMLRQELNRQRQDNEQQRQENERQRQEVKEEHKREMDELKDLLKQSLSAQPRQEVNVTRDAAET